MPNSVPSMNKEDRRRGRPTGKNRKPLSLEERRARNAQYERERRNETAEALAQLAEAVGCDPQISNADLLATVISKIQRASSSEERSIEDLQRINNNLESQIALLTSRLGDDANIDDEELSESDQESEDESESESDSDYEEEPPTKYRKLSRTSTFHENTRSKANKPMTPSDTTSTSDSSSSSWSTSGKTMPRSGKKLYEESNNVTPISHPETPTDTESSNGPTPLPENTENNLNTTVPDTNLGFEPSLLDDLPLPLPDMPLEDISLEIPEDTTLNTLNEQEMTLFCRWLDADNLVGLETETNENDINVPLDIDSFLTGY